MRGFILTGLLLFVSTTFGQYNDILVLNNSSLIRGRLMTSVEGAYRLKMRDGSELVYAISEVDHIEKHIPKMNDKGYFFRPSLSILAGENSSLGFYLVNGYQFSKRLDIGFGIGWENAWGAYVPLFLEGRFYLNSNAPNKFFIYGMNGYEMPISRWNQQGARGGYTCGGAIGLQHNFSDRFAFTTQAGYRYVYLRRDNWWGETTIENNINRIEIKIGLNFK